MARDKRSILWEIGCEGHTDAWVTAENWELATVEAAKFWGVPWREVAAHCEQKNRIVGAPRNICCRCHRVYYGAPPSCDMCEKEAVLEEQRLRQALRRAYMEGRAI